MSRKYFEAIGRQRCSTGLSVLRDTKNPFLPQWAIEAINRGYEQQKPWRSAVTKRAKVLAAESMRTR